MSLRILEALVATAFEVVLLAIAFPPFTISMVVLYYI
nr:MAG TPA: hypothetical protein [Caudoviricetes sp.]